MRNKPKQIKSPHSDIGFLNKDGQSLTIYVGNLNYRVQNFELKKLFENYGIVSYVKMVTDSKTKKKTGIAFVQMPNPRQGQRAIKELDGQVIGGRTLKVSVAKERMPVSFQRDQVKKEKRSSNEVTPPKAGRKPKKKLKGLALLKSLY